MEREEVLASLPGLLLPWYTRCRRDLPWRKDREPYHIWLSEIMLQQTRAEAVKGYYTRFLEILPTVEALADCDDALLHKLWEGLGYYSRVRNLKKAAKIIVEQYGGVFPEEHASVLALPGIGEYTAGAVCSIAFSQPRAAVDGNVLRVCSRLLNDPAPIDQPAVKKRITRELEKIYPKESGDFTQALMELGATVCGPNRRPDCLECPCRDICQGYHMGTAEKLPVKQPKKSRRQENRTVFIMSCAGKYALEKRLTSGLLAGLWQFPNVLGTLETQDALKAVEEMGLRPRAVYKELFRKHIFTHIQWDMKGIYLEVSDMAGDFSWLTAEEIDGQTALPTAFRQFWQEEERHV